MNKDIIYIDVEDDITTIIGKIKAAKERIIALVPPKRIGVLQSAVNMQLLSRTADIADKKIVLITNDHTLSGLAATANIPVAKTLQSKPEMAEIPALKIDDDDIIDGTQLAVGELDDSAKVNPPSSKENDAVAAVLTDENNNADKSRSDSSSTAGQKAQKTPKIPNFNLFRKKLLLIGGGVVLLIGFFVWAVFFAPRATVIITAKTTQMTIDKTVALSVAGKTDAKAGVVKAVQRQQIADLSVEFTPTGKKNVGNKATGKVRFTNSSEESQTVSAGTTLKANGFSFSLDKTVVVPSATLSFGCGGICPSSANGTIVAAEGGSNYNGAKGEVTGAPRKITATIQGSGVSGGTDKTATVVSKDDVNSATEKLKEKKDDSLKNKLAESFGNSMITIGDSYAENRSNPAPATAIDAEANGPVSLKTTVTATMMAIDKQDITAYLNESINHEIEGKKSQKIYDNGEKNLKITQYLDDNNKLSVRFTTTAVIGPEIDENQVKEQVKGKGYGDIQSSIEAISGVQDVDTKFWPFWVRTVPNNANHISVEFKLNNGN